MSVIIVPFEPKLGRTDKFLQDSPYQTPLKSVRAVLKIFHAYRRKDGRIDFNRRSMCFRSRLIWEWRNWMIKGAYSITRSYRLTKDEWKASCDEVADSLCYRAAYSQLISAVCTDDCYISWLSWTKGKEKEILFNMSQRLVPISKFLLLSCSEQSPVMESSDS